MEKQELIELADDSLAIDAGDLPVVPEASKKEEPSAKARLTYKQTHELVMHCTQVPEQSQETWVAMADAVSEKLGFKVTVYSLRMALEAAGRNLDAMLKPAVVLSPIEERIASLERRVKLLEDREPEVF